MVFLSKRGNGATHQQEPTVVDDLFRVNFLLLILLQMLSIATFGVILDIA